MRAKKVFKKGVADAASTLIMFIAVISVTTGLVIAFVNYVDTTQQSFNSQSKLSSNKIKTSISISNVHYDIPNELLYVYVKNIGETSLTTRFFDFFVDDNYLTDFNVTKANDFSQNVTLFQTHDTIVIITNIFLNPGSHEVLVNTEYGVGDIESFNI